jgi:YD repeat-containing protein
MKTLSYGHARRTARRPSCDVTRTLSRDEETKYLYDNYQRVTQTQNFPNPAHPTTEDTCARVTWTYDSNTLDATFSQNSWGRPDDSHLGRQRVHVDQQPHVPLHVQLHAGGLLTKKRVRLDGHNLDATYTYNSEAKVATVQHPSAQNDPGLTYTYSFDSMSRPYSLVDNEPTPYHWVNSVVYGPADEAQMNGTITRTYNSLLQLTWDTTRVYTYSATQNNGRITQSSDASTGTVNYGYDSLNRLSSASSTGGWGETFTYDGFGNLTDKTVTSGAAPPLHMTVNAANNRISTSGYGYDATGNLTSGPGVSFHNVRCAESLSDVCAHL